MKPSTFILVPFAALTSAQFQLQPRAADGSLAQGNLLPVRAEGPYADVVARAKASATGGSGAQATGGATGKAGATGASGAGGKATATGSGAKTTASSSSAASTAAAAKTASSASASPTTVTTSGASAGHEFGFLKSGLLTAAGAALGFAWFL